MKTFEERLFEAHASLDALLEHPMAKKKLGMQYVPDFRDVRDVMLDFVREGNPRCTCCTYISVAKEGDICQVCQDNHYPPDLLATLEPRMKELGIWKGST